MEKLDCLLVNPPISYSKKNIWRELDPVLPPLGLASVAAYAKAKGHSVKIVDCNISCPSVADFESFLKKKILARYNSISVIGLTSVTPTVKKAYIIAKLFKKYYPNSVVILGGPHATFMPEEVLMQEGIDIAVIGEGEVSFEELLSGVKLEEINGIAFKKGSSKIIFTKQRPRALNIDSLPMPAYDLLPVLKYKPAIGTYKRLPAMGVVTSRGCPGKCTYCCRTLGNKLMFKSPEKIYSELHYLVSKYGIKHILFYDDTFTANRDNVLKLCNLIVQRKLDLTWTCFTRVDFVDYALLSKMKEAGCCQIHYGVESADEKVLLNIQKKINLRQVEKAVQWTKKLGIECRLALMVGNPGETRHTIQKSMDFIKRLSPDLLLVNITTPFPGSELFTWADNRRLILTHNWDDYNLAKPIMKLDTLNEREIMDLYKQMYKSFYFRPKYIFNRLTKVNSFGDIINMFHGLKALLSFVNVKAH